MPCRRRPPSPGGWRRGSSRAPRPSAVWPVIVNRSSPVSASQMRTVASFPAVAIHRPSGLHATSLVPMLSPRSLSSSSPGGGVDHGGDRLLEPPGPDRDPLPVRAEGGARRARDLDLGDDLAGGDVDDADHVVGPHRGQPGPVRAERRPTHPDLRPLAPSSSWNSNSSSPVAGSQTRTAPSSPVVASIEPSPLKATSLTSTSWPWNERTDAPVVASRMSTRPDSSGPSVTKMVPSGLQSSATTDTGNAEHDA